MIESKRKPQPFPVIHKNECKACDRCVITCKNNVLEMSKDINDNGYNYVKYKGEGCNGCGDCYYTCPEPLAIEIHIPKRKRSKTIANDYSSSDSNINSNNGNDTNNNTKNNNTYNKNVNNDKRRKN